MRLGFIIHGRLRQHTKLVSGIAKAFSGWQTENYFTEYAGHAQILAAECAKAGFTHVVVCAGDGCLNEVVNGLLDTGLRAEELPIVSILPFGTGNDFIKSINGPKDCEGLRQLIEAGSILTVDAGFASLHDSKGQSKTRCFINIAEVGLGGSIAEKMDGSKKLFGSFLTFQYYIVSTLLSYKPSFLRVKTGEKEMNSKMMNLVIANGRFFAGGLCVSPDGVLNDGQLNVIQMGDVSILDYVKNLPRLKKAEKIEHPEVYYYNTESIGVDSQMPMPVDMDGELAGYTPLHISVRKRALRFIGNLIL